ncbi:hypothetical protein B0T40_24970 [Chromobacterium haemolyticum]|nr:hypothetical protein B0T40_24970 [Chromobacterium haemolyticum]
MLSSAIEFSLLVWLVFANSTLPEFFDGFLPSALHLHHFRGLYLVQAKIIHPVTRLTPPPQYPLSRAAPNHAAQGWQAQKP